jgi:GH24 family phage-related lysozyme (muramidase)
LSGICQSTFKTFFLPRLFDLLAGTTAVFEEVTVARFYALCVRTYPRFEELHPNAQPALLSLTFNRGDSMAGPRRAEMRAIRELTRAKNYAVIAGQLRAMKRIGRGTDIEAGMARRREAEARLVESAK